MKKYYICFGIALLNACSQGTSQPTPKAPVGPISYKQISLLYTESATSQQLLSASSGCGSIFSYTGTALRAVSLLAGVPALGQIGITAKLIAGSHATSCATASISQLSNALNTQQQEITSIQAELDLDQNIFYTAYYQGAAAIAGLYSYDYNTALTNIVGDNIGDFGLFGNFMIDTGLWISGVTPNQNADVSNIASNSTQMTNAAEFINGNQSEFQASIANVTGSGYSLDSCRNGNCYSYITVDNNSALIQMYASLANSLNAQNNTWLHDNSNPNYGQSIVGNYDNYNNTIMSIYQQSANAIQDAYMMEFTINQLNYYNGINANATIQLDSLSNIPATHYNYNTLGVNATESQQILAYNQAQQQLSLFYAATFNQLYQNTLHYIITDMPLGAQSWPTQEARFTINGTIYNDASIVDYESVVATVTNTPVSQFNGSNWSSGNILYQYSGINNLGQCATSLDEYNQASGSALLFEDALNQSNCSPIFWNPVINTAYNQSVYSSSQLTAYMAPENTYPQLTGAVSWNVQECGSNPVSSSLIYSNSGGVNYLACTNPSWLPAKGSVSDQNVSAYVSNVSADNKDASSEIGSNMYLPNLYAMSSNPANQVSSDYSLSLPTNLGWYESFVALSPTCNNKTQCHSDLIVVNVMLPNGVWLPLYLSVNGLDKDHGGAMPMYIQYYNSGGISASGYSCSGSNNSSVLTCVTATGTYLAGITGFYNGWGVTFTATLQ